MFKARELCGSSRHVVAEDSNLAGCYLEQLQNCQAMNVEDYPGRAPSRYSQQCLAAFLKPCNNLINVEEAANQFGETLLKLLKSDLFSFVFKSNNWSASMRSYIEGDQLWNALKTARVEVSLRSNVNELIKKEEIIIVGKTMFGNNPRTWSPEQVSFMFKDGVLPEFFFR